MMEKTLILKHISEMLCLLISYSKFTRPKSRILLTTEKHVLYDMYISNGFDMKKLNILLKSDSLL